jgi:tryptophan 2,3-dioxygenase
MPNRELLIDLARWTARPEAQDFPLDAVIAEFRRVGKHFVDGELLDALAEARAALPTGVEQLRRFLDTALDKYDSRFDNPTYLALHDLPLPTTAGRCPLDTSGAERQRDRLIALLVAGVLRFELAALDGTTELMPLLRPDARIVGKRCALGLRVLRTALTRIGIDAETGIDDAIASARILCARVEAGQTADERRMLAVTLLTVSTVHDEHLFVRLLQCYETSFALVSVELRAAIVAARSGDVARTTRALGVAAKTMDEAAPLFSLVATMLPEAFMTFREYTDGASAIQSRSYKTIESLCRRPDPERLAGPGYDAVPEVRACALAGEPTLEEALAQSPLARHQLAEVRAAMAALEAEVMGWRKTHHNLAMRMLGMRRGTGYTAGVPYLAETRDIPLFRCPFALTYAQAA